VIYTGEGTAIGAKGLVQGALCTGDRAARASALETGGGSRLPLPVNPPKPHETLTHRFTRLPLTPEQRQMLRLRGFEFERSTSDG
jgi:hypothetical protein